LIVSAPHSDGQSEVRNRTLEAYLRCFVNGQPKQWLKWLGWAELWFNSSFNSSIGMSHVWEGSTIYILGKAREFKVWISCC